MQHRFRYQAVEGRSRLQRLENDRADRTDGHLLRRVVR